MEFLNIPYDITLTERDPLREFDLYLPLDAANQLPSPLICFAHGGAWRAEDKTDHKLLARKLAASTRYPVAIPNYRLTPREPPGDNHFKHPGHAEDLLSFLSFLTSWQGPSGIGQLYDPHTLYLMGHSCSAHMLTSIFLDSSSITPTLTPPTSLIQAVKGIIVSEGIYDLEILLSDFPQYQGWFIGPTFGRNAAYASFSTTRFSLRNPDIRWLVIHSKGDTLVNFAQSEAILNHLIKLNGEDAKHRVNRSMGILDGEHNDILVDDDYVKLAVNFILAE
ncbi:Alpha/Beta hydrolase protein [Collybia nuda]|uniref:Alpha/Beta hydrolase protein n=1 Tax=Collybia nuda TaxID=64659 RepID=A0A9P5XW40_9AGAR|nr:Alpha/Beta hydrolase protein [Collybia nuda]